MPRPQRGPFKNRLPELLVLFNFTGKDLSDRTGIRPPRISALTLGHDLAQPAELDAITKALGVTPEGIYDPPFLSAIDHAAGRRVRMEEPTAA